MRLNSRPWPLQRNVLCHINICHLLKIWVDVFDFRVLWRAWALKPLPKPQLQSLRPEVSKLSGLDPVTGQIWPRECLRGRRPCEGHSVQKIHCSWRQSLHDICRPNELPVALAQAFDLKGDGRVSCWEFTRGLHNLQAGASGSGA